MFHADGRVTMGPVVGRFSARFSSMKDDFTLRSGFMSLRYKSHYQPAEAVDQFTDRMLRKR